MQQIGSINNALKPERPMVFMNYDEMPWTELQEADPEALRP